MPDIYLRVSINTPATDAKNETYQHIVQVPHSDTPEATLLGVQYAIIDAINTLYKYENVIGYNVEVIDEADLPTE